MSKHNPPPGMSELQRPNTYVGAPIERVEDLRFLRGRGCYLDDLSRSGQWHAAFVRSPFAHGAIQRLDTPKALSMGGVQAVITGVDIGPAIPTIPFRPPNPPIAPHPHPVIPPPLRPSPSPPVSMPLAHTPA